MYFQIITTVFALTAATHAFAYHGESASNTRSLSADGNGRISTRDVAVAWLQELQARSSREVSPGTVPSTEFLAQEAAREARRKEQLEAQLKRQADAKRAQENKRAAEERKRKAKELQAQFPPQSF